MHTWNQQQGCVYLTAGTGYGKTPLAAFDVCEVNAKIIATNAIRVTSFVPPGWRIELNNNHLAQLSDKGAFLPMAYQFESSDRELVSAALVIGKNADPEQASIIMEYAQIGVDSSSLLKTAMSSIDEVFAIRGWKVGEYLPISVECRPKDGMHAGAFVAALYFPDSALP